eukprot:5848125-Amphidinium_carterae.1
MHRYQLPSTSCTFAHWERGFSSSKTNKTQVTAVTRVRDLHASRGNVTTLEHKHSCKQSINIPLEVDGRVRSLVPTLTNDAD